VAALTRHVQVALQRETDVLLRAFPDVNGRERLTCRVDALRLEE
jgi:hypothetical protein